MVEATSLDDIASPLEVGPDASWGAKSFLQCESVRHLSLMDEYALGVFPDVSSFRWRVYQPAGQPEADLGTFECHQSLNGRSRVDGLSRAS